ncbi:MAG: filamentous hemagglutinin N-terminal domain-containing protein [Gammaproteobacteria bacterium]|nr:filamentous hemagglutinin N-terminal domain-containing protein [Gammaproteobacteria bacterium]
MKKHTQRRGDADVWILLFCLWGQSASRAEVVTDGTMGEQRELSGPKYQIGAELGQQHGGNLFHSFRDFNLELRERAIFSGPTEVQNVLARVTGGRASEINGRLRSTIPKADFYFINPAGIRFGPYAALDVQGAFHASTATYLKLGEGGRFDALAPENSILNMAPPQAFGFIGGDAAPVSIRGPLIVPAGELLSVTGGEISVDDGRLYAPDGTVHIASLAGSGEVDVDPKKAGLAEFSRLGKIRISYSVSDGFQGAVDVSGSVPQGIFIRGGRFFLNNAAVNAKKFLSSGGEKSAGEPGGDILISARENIVLRNEAMISTDSFIPADAGNVNVRTETFDMRNNAGISSDTQDSGRGGTITVQASRVTMNGTSRISSETRSGGTGGNVRIRAASLDMGETATVNTAAYRSGHSAGEIVAIAADTLRMTDDATINSGTFFEGAGNGGKVSIEARRVFMTDAAWIIGSSFNRGKSGLVQINAETMDLSAEAAVAVNTFSRGNGGNLDIDVRETLSLSGKAVITSGTESSGRGGNVNLNAGRIVMTGDVNVSSATEGKNFFIRGVEMLADAAGLLESDGYFTGGGDAGQVFINADNLSLRNGAVIDSSSGTGMAGHVDIAIKNDLHLKHSTVSTAADYADGGNIRIQAGGLAELCHSAVTSSIAGGAGDGGNITLGGVPAPEYVVLNNSRIIANAHAGRGGNILIRTDNLLRSTNSRVNASSSLGIDGTVRIETPDENASQNPVILPGMLLKQKPISLESCSWTLDKLV